MYILVSIVFIKIAIVGGLTCDEILELPPDKNVSLIDLQSTQPEDIVQCLSHLGRKKLVDSEADFIWKAIIQFYKGIENIPDSALMFLHWITVAVKPEDYANITLNNIDVIQNFGLNYDLSGDQISAIADRVREDFASKEPEDYTYYDLTALGQILCAFNKSEIERIPPSSYKEAAILVGKLERCHPDVMSGFAKLAIHERAFGPRENWTDAMIKNIGNVARYASKQETAKTQVSNTV